MDALWCDLIVCLIFRDNRQCRKEYGGSGGGLFSFFLRLGDRGERLGFRV